MITAINNEELVHPEALQALSTQLSNENSSRNEESLDASVQLRVWKARCPSLVNLDASDEISHPPVHQSTSMMFGLWKGVLAPLSTEPWSTSRSYAN